MSEQESKAGDCCLLWEDPTIKQCQSRISHQSAPSYLSNSLLNSSNSPPLLSPSPNLLDMSTNIHGIKTNPFQFITKQTSRDTLFKIIYILEAENQQQHSKLQANRQLLQQKVQEKPFNGDLREAVIQYVQNMNRQHAAENKLLILYNQQKEKLKRSLTEKEKSINAVRAEKEEKERRFFQLQKLLKQSSDKLVLLKEKKTKLIDDINRKKNNEKLADSGVIDKLLREYFQTIQEVLDDSSSVERINNNAKTALVEVGRTKIPGMFSAFIEEIEASRNKVSDN